MFKAGALIYLLNPTERKPGVSIYPRKCELCNSTYASRQSFCKHRKRCLYENSPDNSTIEREPFINSKKCELCDVEYATKQSYYNHRKRCLIQSSPENYPRTCNVCSVQFISHISFISHKKCCKSIRKAKAETTTIELTRLIDVPVQKRPKTDTGEVEETDNGVMGVEVSSSHLVTEQSSVYNEGCVTCQMSKDKYGMMPPYHYHKTNCLASKSSESYSKYLTNHNAVEEIEEEYCISKERDKSTYTPNSKRHKSDCRASTDVTNCGAIEETVSGTIEILKEQNEVSNELKIVSDQCQNIHEECKKSKENSAIMIALLKENNTLYESIANNINLILQIKAAKNNVPIISNDE